MITATCQRWRARRDSYRPAGEVIRTADYEVASIPGDREAKAFVVEHHYSASYPAARERVGLYRHGALVGVAVFSMPVRGSVLDHLPCPREAAVELGRLVLLDDVPANGETWMLARAFDLLRQRGYEGVISHADPVPRTNAAGARVFPGHIGVIYQASNAVYAGLATARTLRLLPDGSVFSERSISKVRARERGWRYSVEQLVAAGAPEPGADLRAWLPIALAAATRRLKHGGNHRYLIGLHRAVKRRLPPSLPYPKLDAGRFRAPLGDP